GRRETGHEARPCENGERLAVGCAMVLPRFATAPIFLLVMERLPDPNDEHEREHLAVHDRERLTEKLHHAENDRHRQRDARETGHDVGPATEIDEEDHHHHRQKERDATQHAGQDLVGVYLLDLWISGHLRPNAGLARPLAYDATKRTDRVTTA